MQKFSLVFTLIVTLVAALIYSNQITIDSLTSKIPMTAQSAGPDEEETQTNPLITQIIEEDVHLPFQVILPFLQNSFNMTSFPVYLGLQIQLLLLEFIKPPSKFSF